MRSAASVALLAAAVVFSIVHFGDVTKAASRLSSVEVGWVALAVVAEAGSMLVFALLQQRLLRAGCVHLGLVSMGAITLASNALTGTLPGGVGWAAAWQFDQLGRRGVSRFLRIWTFLVAGGVSSFALFIVIAVGVETAGSEGPVSTLRWLVFLLALIPIVALVVEVFHNTAPVASSTAALRRWVGRLPGGRRVLGWATNLASRMTAVKLGGLGWATVLGLALLNWLLDALVVVSSLLALGVKVPWSAILVIYGLTQIAASVPLTPGGIGVVAGSLAALLHAYGVPTSSALAVVLLYRLLSFWVLVPIGWAIWGLLELRGRRVARGVPRPRYGLSPMLDPEAEPTRPTVALPLRGNEREAGGARAEPAGAEPGIPSRTAAGSAGG
ncbi:MAG TPA: lysylphosphatidylglycerol synthase transmembrane domain-containing protein [Acidimicrobiales bacterium]|nr:lysylphosphatidylglycerol synthase transmembrane domain-containing protein [Acidimicrobiales bacterium]